MLPAEAEQVIAEVNPAVAQSWRKLFILLSVEKSLQRALQRMYEAAHQLMSKLG
jgi:hypothetical protein